MPLGQKITVIQFSMMNNNSCIPSLNVLQRAQIFYNRHRRDKEISPTLDRYKTFQPVYICIMGLLRNGKLLQSTRCGVVPYSNERIRVSI